MAQVRRSGGRVAVVTATRGEHGTDDPHGCPPRRLARVRERELRKSLDALDVHEHAWLGHHDSPLPSVPRHLGVAQVVESINQVQPDTIVTFGPDGMTGHTDHQTISSWVTEAWRTTGCAGDLWYATFTPEFHERWGSVNEQANLWFEGTVPAVTPHTELAAQVECTGDLLTVKNRALRAHTSQTRPLEALVGTEVYREWWATESFVAAPRW